jgi:hypothetical protein
MLGPVRIQRPLARQIARVFVPFLAKETVLFALELVQEDLVERLVEVLADARGDLFENV